MKRSLMVGLTAGILVIGCLCITLSVAGGLFILSGKNNQEASTSRTPALGTPGSRGGAETGPTDLAAAGSTADTFLTALRDNLNEEAFTLFHPDLQRQFVSPDNLRTQIDKNNVRPKTWGKWKADTSAEADPNTTRILTTISYQDGSTGTVDFEIGRLDGETAVFAFNLKH